MTPAFKPVQCLTCGSQPQPPVPDIQGNLVPDQWWGAWPCIYCGEVVCNQPVNNEFTCYMKHNCDKHPKVYLPKEDKPTGGHKKNKKKRK